MFFVALGAFAIQGLPPILSASAAYVVQVRLGVPLAFVRDVSLSFNVVPPIIDVSFSPASVSFSSAANVTSMSVRVAVAATPGVYPGLFVPCVCC